MTNEAKQYICDTIALQAQEVRQALWILHPEASLGGDGPWNNYGEDNTEDNTMAQQPCEAIPHWKSQLTGDEGHF